MAAPVNAGAVPVVVFEDGFPVNSGAVPVVLLPGSGRVVVVVAKVVMGRMDTVPVRTVVVTGVANTVLSVVTVAVTDELGSALPPVVLVTFPAAEAAVVAVSALKILETMLLPMGPMSTAEVEAGGAVPPELETEPELAGVALGTYTVVVESVSSVVVAVKRNGATVGADGNAGRV